MPQEYLRTKAQGDRKENTTPQGVEIFRASGRQASTLYAAKSFTSRCRRIVHSRPKNKAATLFKPEEGELSSGGLPT